MLCVLIYGCETWTINGQDNKKLEIMEMWTWRSLLKVIWTERKSNVDELNVQVEKKRILLNIIKERSRKIFGHLH